MEFLEKMVTLFTKYNSFFSAGVANTIILALFTVLLGTILGTLLAIM